ncbi:cysteine desulfurase-like protein [Emergencia timonensis]|uniref:cysteine desulfurase-like protein n=1 Tax=Emergencia timonensis TaxID=1776384 RepID=UPI0008297239|nr:cysteine desulfurase-like protein [Emergencia timonensis]WNX87092.1 cysteine desulfurase-like protein [Emergencia timonensis]
MAVNFKFDVDYIREQFPALSITVNGLPAAFLDGPGGTQVPKRVAEKVNEYMFYRNANEMGAFKTSQESDQSVLDARGVFAHFFNCDPEEVAFGENTSSINFKLSYAFARALKPGDEVLITNIDHEGNRSPWRVLEDFGIVVKCVDIDPETITLDFEDFKAKLSDKTKILAINWAANSCGTVSDVKKFIAEAHKYGAVTVVDAVHYAPHKVIDVKEIDTDILVCSAYKFFGPHLGVVYVRRALGDKLVSTRVMAGDNTEMPLKMETGTLAMELVNGAAEAVEFIADCGRCHAEQLTDELEGLSGLRRDIVAGLRAFEIYEEGLANKLREELSKIDGLKVYGPGAEAPRTSTVSFTIEGVNSNEIAKFFAERGLFVWDGDFYAIATINNVLGLEPAGGFLRVGFAPYNLMSDVERVIEAVKDFIKTK